MPNWCNNTVTVKGEPEKIREFASFLESKDGKGWFDFFIEPADENEEGWYEYNVENYGCKWNCDAQDVDVSDDTITFWFDSPWSPPTKLFEKVVEDGFELTANYHEEGMGFVGLFEDGDDYYYEYDLDDPESLDEIPEDIVDYWDLRTLLEDWNEQKEEDDEDYDSDEDISATLEDLQSEFDAMKGENDEK